MHDMKTKHNSETGKRESIKQVTNLVQSLMAIADADDLSKLALSLQPKRVNDLEVQLAQDIAGDEYIDEPSWHLELSNLHRLYEHRRRLLEKSLSSTEVATLLDWKTRKTIHDKLKNKDILGIKDKGMYRFPLFQFDPQGDDGILDGFPQVLKALEVSDFTKLNWLSKPHPAFDNLTPVEMLRQRKLDDVLTEAKGVNLF